MSYLLPTPARSRSRSASELTSSSGENQRLCERTQVSLQERVGVNLKEVSGQSVTVREGDGKDPAIESRRNIQHVVRKERNGIPNRIQGRTAGNNGTDREGVQG